MEGNRVKKSKHVNLLIQTCNHVMSVSTIYMCNSGDVSYVSQKCIPQCCTLHLCNCLISDFTFLCIKIDHCFLKYIRSSQQFSVCRLNIHTFVPYNISVDTLQVNKCQVYMFVEFRYWPYMEWQRKFTIITENRMNFRLWDETTCAARISFIFFFYQRVSRHHYKTRKDTHIYYNVHVQHS